MQRWRNIPLPAKQRVVFVLPFAKPPIWILDSYKREAKHTLFHKTRGPMYLDSLDSTNLTSKRKTPQRQVVGAPPRCPLL
jgi:hypothetical protein